MNYLRAARRRPETSAFPGLLPRLNANSDYGRAPVTFGWMAYTAGGRTSRYFHLETLYRLNRSEAFALAASPLHDMSIAQLRELLLARQAALLPRLPTGYQWVGPELVENVEIGSSLQLQGAARPAINARVEAQLSAARCIATKVLREREQA